MSSWLDVGRYASLRLPRWMHTPASLGYTHFMRCTRVSRCMHPMHTHADGVNTLQLNRSTVATGSDGCGCSSIMPCVCQPVAVSREPQIQYYGLPHLYAGEELTLVCSEVVLLYLLEHMCSSYSWCGVRLGLAVSLPSLHSHHE